MEPYNFILTCLDMFRFVSTELKSQREQEDHLGIPNHIHGV